MPDPLPPDVDVVSTADLAHEVGVTRQMLGKWCREGLEDVAKLGWGKWDRQKAIAWISDRREDSPNFDGREGGARALMEARIKLYQAQAQGADIRNRAAEAELVLRTKAAGAFAEVVTEQIAVGDAWARDARTPACDSLRKHISEAAVLALKAELWNELRHRNEIAVDRVAARLATGEDMGPTRIRISRSVG